MENFENALNGLPCHRYIVRNLKDENDILEFERSFINTMRSHSFPDDDIEAALCMMSSHIPKNSPIWGKTLNMTGTGVKMNSFLDTILFDSSILGYSSCVSFYRKFDRSCRGCLMCPYSNKYTRQNFPAEKSLIRYILSSQTHMERLLAKGIVPNLFKSVFDVTEYAVSPRVYPITLFESIMESLSHEDIFSNYYLSDCTGFGSDIYQYLRTKIRRMKLPGPYAEKNWIDKVISVWEFELYMEEVCSDADADRNLSSILHPNANTQQVPVSPSVSLLIQVDDSAAISETDLTEETFPPEEISQVEKIPHTKTSATEQIKDTPDVYPGKNVAEEPTDASIPLSNGCPFAAYCSNESEDAKTSAVSTTVYEVINNKDIDEPYINVESTDTSRKPLYVTHMDMGDNLIFMPSLLCAELSACTISLDTQNVLILTQFENTVRRNKVVAVELAYDETQKPLLLFWVQPLHTFFYTRLISPAATNIVALLFSHNSIKKLCYSPYALYSTARENAMQIRNLISLQSCHYISDTTHTDYISAMLSYGVHPAIPGITYKVTGNVNSAVLLYMPYYHTVHRIQDRTLSYSEQERYTQIRYRDEALGYSYSLMQWQNNTNRLFKLISPTAFEFATIDPSSIKLPGYLAYYIFPNMPNKYFSFDLVCSLSSAGRFRKCQMWIAKLTANGIVLFIEESFFEYLSTYISSQLLILQESYGLLETKVSIGYMKVSPENNSDHTLSGMAPKRPTAPLSGRSTGIQNTVPATAATTAAIATGATAVAPAERNRQSLEPKTVPAKENVPASSTSGKISSSSQRENPAATKPIVKTIVKNIPPADIFPYVKEHNLIVPYTGSSLVGADGYEYTGNDNQLPF